VSLYFTGFADEAAADIEGQIAATQKLGWKHIESRNISGQNIHDIPDDMFEKVCGHLSEAGIRVNCFGSTVANWATNPYSDEDFDNAKKTLTRAIRRMKVLDCNMIRAMSFGLKHGKPTDGADLEKIIFSKVNELVNMCEDAGIYYVHENCMNFGGQSHEHTLRLLDNIKSKYFKLCFDTGNPVFTYRRIGSEPYHKQSTLEFYNNVKEYVHYIHIKDGIYEKETDGIFPQAAFTFPGEGNGQVREVLTDLLQNGYSGGISIEPHMAIVFHDQENSDKDEIQMKNYIEYGNRTMNMVEEIRKQL
jgi:sugar phosphate isomerase/epimerase